MAQVREDRTDVGLAAQKRSDLSAVVLEETWGKRTSMTSVSLGICSVRVQ